MAPAPGFRNLTIRDETVNLVDQLRRELPEIPTRPSLIHWALEYAKLNKKDFLGYAEARRLDDD